MNEVNRTLFIPLYGKSLVSKQGILLNDPTAEQIWEEEKFPIPGKARSKWLAYNMAMRARVFDEWTTAMLGEYPDALVLQIGCGLDSRCYRVKGAFKNWIDCDFSSVISVRKKYFKETETYHMTGLDASDPEQIKMLPHDKKVILILEGLSMYLKTEEMHGLFQALQTKYDTMYVLLDVYTKFGVKASKLKNPVKDVGVTTLYAIDNIENVIHDLPIRFKVEHSFTPARLIDELKPIDRFVFRMLFTGRLYRMIYRLFELESERSC